MRFWAWLGRIKAALGRWWQRLFGRASQGSLDGREQGMLAKPEPWVVQDTVRPVTDAEFEELPKDAVAADDRTEAEPTEADRLEAQAARNERKAVEQRLAEESLAAEQEAAKQAEARKAEAARLAEESRLAEEQEAARLAEESRLAEEQEAARLAEERAKRHRAHARHRAQGTAVALKAFEQLARQRERNAEREAREAEERAQKERARAERERNKLLRDLARHAATRAGVAVRAFNNLARLREEEAARAYREAHRFVRRRSIEAEIAVRAFTQLEQFREIEAEEELRRQAEEEERLRVEAEEAVERERKQRAWAQVEIPKDYSPAPESNHDLYRLDLDGFEGPLDLLLFLIRRHKLDIFDIPMAFVCEQYLEYIKLMEDLNIDVASEFMFMAAELLHIKSKMLLPRPADVDGEEEDVDPRGELVRRLLEYQKYKGAALHFSDSTWLNRDTFARDPERIEVDRRAQPLREVGVFALIEAFDNVLERQKPEFRHQVMMEQSSVAERVRQVVEVLAGRGPTPFTELLGPVRSRIDVVVSFLAMLEMTKMHLLRIYESIEGTLYIKPRFDTLEIAMQQIEQLDDTVYAG